MESTIWPPFHKLVSSVSGVIYQKIEGVSRPEICRRRTRPRAERACHPLRQVTESGELAWLNGRLTSCRILL